MVNGYKLERHDPWYRIFLGTIYQYFVKILFQLPIKDTDCDFRLIENSVFKKVKLFETTGTICVELVKKISHFGFKIVEVPVNHYDCPSGFSQFFNPSRLYNTFVNLGEIMVETKHIAGLFALIVGVGLLLRQISFFPYPEMLTETYFLSKGMLPYVQINDQHFPGLFLLPTNLRTLGFDNVEKLRWLHLGLIGFTTLVLYKLIGKLRWIILFLTFFLLWEGNTLWVDSFVAPLVLLAFYGLWSKWSFRTTRNLF